MPGVTVLNSSPALRSPGPTSPSLSRGSSGSHDDMSVAEIRETANAAVNRVRGASSSSLIKLAREKAMRAVDLEATGELKGALSNYIMAASLTSMALESSEPRVNVRDSDFIEYQQKYGNDLFPRITKLQARLTELEKAAKPHTNGTTGSASDGNDGPSRKSGGTIADRVRSLHDAGMSVSAVTTNKRLSRDFSANPPPPVEHQRQNVVSRTPSSQGVSSPPSAQSDTFPQSQRHSGVSMSHSFVALSSFGPPSPTSSTASSPRLGHMNISEFSQVFPSIDELDEMGSNRTPQPALPNLPSVPTNKPGTPANMPLVSPSVTSRFPSLPLHVDPGPRPASEPVTPTVSSQISRSASPTHGRFPVPPKTTGFSVSPKTSSSAISATTSGDRVDLPLSNTIFPKQLYEYLNTSGLSVLLFDVRDRDQYEREHIKGEAVVCLEPTVLSRDGLTGEGLEDSLTVATREEFVVFNNREKFDLVVMYDADAEVFTPAMLSVSRIVFETAFRKMLKKPPVILVGGLRAWKTAYPRDVAARSRLVPDAVSRATSANGIPYNAYDSRSDDHSPRIRPSSMLASTSSTSSDGMRGSTAALPNGHSADPSLPSSRNDSRVRYSIDQIPENSRSYEPNGTSSQETMNRSNRRPALVRPSSISNLNTRPGLDNQLTNGQHQSQYSMNPLHSTGSGSVQYPAFPRSTTSTFSASYASGTSGVVSPPPASVSPSPSRRRSDYIDQSEQAVSSFTRGPIDYPVLSSGSVLRAPPVAATTPLERQDNRPRIQAHASSSSFSMSGSGPKPPMIQSDYPVTYWPDLQVATRGLKNLGNTCYMNATIQCLSATIPFAHFFTDGRWKSAVNMVNPLGTKGILTKSFASILYDLWHEELSSLAPHNFRKSFATYAHQFAGSDQHDSQEFLSYLLDGLHEDLNRIITKPAHVITPEREAELERLPQQIASDQEWQMYRMRNDSIVVDFFQGQFRNRMECMTCKHTSTTYNAFMSLTLPIPSARGVKQVSLHQCLEAFVREEVMEKSDAWHCPNCKVLRKATKRLSLSRLPPVLLIHLKRFSLKGPSADKLETVVEFPLRGLDLTNYMPSPLPPGDRRQPPAALADDPREQVPPYRYDLYGVTNHTGTLTTGHYTAFINSRGGWLYCDDSRVTQADAKEVVGRPAYMLFYKRCKP